jgi:hypothetical protein
MEWNSIKMAQHFLSRANGLHPEEERGSEAYEVLLAQQDLYYECYMTSFSKEKLIQFLDKSISGDVKIPEEEVDEDRYRKAYAMRAKTTLGEIENK